MCAHHTSCMQSVPAALDVFDIILGEHDLVDGSSRACCKMIHLLEERLDVLRQFQLCNDQMCVTEGNEMLPMNETRALTRSSSPPLRRICST